MSANGRLVDGELVWVEDNDRLIPTAGRAFLAFKAYAASQGRTLAIAEPAGAYRSYAVQVDMLAHPGNYGLNTDSKAGLAKAGYSGHGFGNRVDLVGTSLAWIVANAGRFGFWREFGANDPNHFAHNGTIPAGAPPLPIDNTPTPKPTPKKDRTMLLSGTTTGGGMLTTETGSAAVNGQEYTLLRRLIVSDQTRNAGLGGDFPEVFLSVEYAVIDAALARTRPAPTAPASIPLTDSQLEALAVKVAAHIPAPAFPYTLEQIATAVADENAKRLGNG